MLGGTGRVTRSANRRAPRWTRRPVRLDSDRKGCNVATDLTIALADRPGTLAKASDVLGRASINIEGACGFVCGDVGTFHVLVGDAERARRALIDAGFEIQAERRVAVTPVEHRPSAAAAILRRVADAGLNIDLLYLTADGQLVLGGPDVAGIARALA